MHEFQETVTRPWWIFQRRLHFLKQPPVERRTYGLLSPGFPGDRPPTAERTLVNLFQSLHQNVSLFVSHPTVPVRKISVIYYCGTKVDPLQPEAAFDTSKLQWPGNLHGFKGTSPVDFFPQGTSPYGCLDMAGNVWQWCSTRIAPYPYRVDDGREDTETHLENEKRTYRGGGWVMNSWRGDWTILHRGNYFLVEGAESPDQA